MQHTIFILRMEGLTLCKPLTDMKYVPILPVHKNEEIKELREKSPDGEILTP